MMQFNSQLIKYEMMKLGTKNDKKISLNQFELV